MNAELAARMPARISLARVRPHLPLGAILALAAYLDFWNLGRNGYANTYYAAAVRSMLASWHNFFFASFDAGGLVSVDKPPLALWAEAASAKLFGYSGVTILLPEALAGVVAVWLLYLTVARVFGRPGALVAALALALSPVSVAVNRDNNPDALFACLLVGAAYAGVRAVQSGRLRWLLGAAVLVGLAFNTKMLAAGIVVPGLAAAYALLAPHRWRARLAHVGLAGVVLVLVSGAWIAAVDLTPAVDRPYVGSTTDNSALSLALGYNGLGRVTGQEGGTSVGGGLGGAFSGTPGPLRLLNDALGDQGAWLLPLAIVGGLVALGLALRARRRPELAALTVLGGWFVAGAAVFSLSSGIIHTYYLSALAPATAALVGIGALALWRNARAGGRQLAFPLLALVATCWLEVALLRRSDYLPWLQALAIATTVAAALALALLAPGGVRPDRLRRLLATGALGIGLAGLLAAPAAWAATTLKAPVNGVFPGAGPSFVSGLSTSGGSRGFAGGRFGGGGAPPQFGAGRLAPPAGRTPGFTPPVGGFRPGGGIPGRGGAGATASGEISNALAYVRSHGATKRFALIVSSEQEAAAYVIRGEAVAAMGGFTGRETVLTRSYLARLISSGEARYFLLGGSGRFAGPGGSANAAASLISSTCRQVSAAAWSGGSASAAGGGGSLYDCAGRAAAIAGA